MPAIVVIWFRSPTLRSIARALAGFCLVVESGCSHAPSDVREWRASDHDRADETERTRATVPAKPKASADRARPSASAAGVDALVELTWRRECAACHGSSGRGDGPQGALVQAPDLSRSDWQERTRDDEIAKTIVGGRGRMPSFALPEGVVSGLVRRVRSLRKRD